MYYKATLIRKDDSGPQIQNNRTEEIERNIQLHQFIFDKGVKTHNGKKGNPFQQMVLGNWILIYKECKRMTRSASCTFHKNELKIDQRP